MSDLTLDKNYKMGDKSEKVKLFQEWLCLHNFHVAIDGFFGPVTDITVRSFQRKKRLVVDGIVGNKTFAALIQPVKNAIEEIIPGNRSLGEMMVTYAKQHLKQHPREIGGQNRGPWVRLYMDGNDGPEWKWCAGFVSYILGQACKSLRISRPIKKTYSCDNLAKMARENGIFIAENSYNNYQSIKQGYIYLQRKVLSDWNHTGIVIKAERDVFHSIEGNANDDNRPEGYEVCARHRGYLNKDFIAI